VAGDVAELAALATAAAGTLFHAGAGLGSRAGPTLGAAAIATQHNRLETLRPTELRRRIEAGRLPA